MKTQFIGIMCLILCAYACKKDSSPETPPIDPCDQVASCGNSTDLMFDGSESSIINKAIRYEHHQNWEWFIVSEDTIIKYTFNTKFNKASQCLNQRIYVSVNNYFRTYTNLRIDTFYHSTGDMFRVNKGDTIKFLVEGLDNFCSYHATFKIE